MVVHAIACAICRSKCDEHSGRVCGICKRAIEQKKARVFKSEPEKFRAEAEADGTMRKKVLSF